MSVKAKVEAIIYATEEPVTLNQLASLLREPVLAEMRAADETAAAEVQPGPEELTDEQLKEADKEQARQVKSRLARILEELTADYAAGSHGVEVRQIAGGYRMGTKPEHHDVVVGFAKSLKPPVKLSLPALETLAVIAYKQPVTVPEISEIRGVDSSGVIATLLDRKLITTGGRKQVIGRPILYKTTKEFLVRFGLDDVSELPSMEEFEKLGDPQAELFSTADEGVSVEPVAVPDGEEPATADGEPLHADTAEPSTTQAEQSPADGQTPR